MHRIFFLSLALVSVSLVGCPERDALVDHVGGAPGRQVDDARVRIKAAEKKMQQRTSDDAVPTE